MQLPIVQHPSIVVNNLPYLASVFQTEEQKKHFCEYVTGLIAGDKKTITTINGLFLNNNDQSVLNKFLRSGLVDFQQSDAYGLPAASARAYCRCLCR
jgi:hypothetical protein